MKDLTVGSIPRNLISFTIPLILGNIFQITYNAVDSIIIGRIAGDAALAAVSSADPVMNLLILGVSGLCIGASVLMSSFFGAGRYDEVRREMGTVLSLNAFLAAFILCAGLLFSRSILIAMQVPAEILPDAVTYLRIIFIGMPFTCIYNVYSAGLRSIGDSVTPIKYLALSSVTNGLLDYIFIYYLSLGTFGAALATVIAESMSAILCILHVKRKVPLLKLSREFLRPDRILLRQTLQLGTTSAIQQCAQPIGKLFIQGMVNSLGITTMAAFNAVEKVELIALAPERSIGNALMTFTAQNSGAGKRNRVRKGFFTGLVLELLYFSVAAVLLYLCRRPIMSLFSRNEATLDVGTRYITYMVFFYWLPGWTNAVQGFLRGSKRMTMGLVCSATQISLRVLVTWLLLDSFGLSGIAIACAVGWSGMLLLAFPYIYLHRLISPDSVSD